MPHKKVEVEVRAAHLTAIHTDAMITGIFEDDCQRLKDGSEVPEWLTHDELFFQLIKPFIEDGEIDGSLTSATMLHNHDRAEVNPKRIIVVGLGKYEEITLDRLRGMSAVAGRFLRQIKCRSMGIYMGFIPPKLRFRDTAMAVIEGFILGQYRFDRYICQKKFPEEINSFGIYIPENRECDPQIIRQSIIEGAVIARATNLARDLCNEPANVLTPHYLGEIAQDLGRRYGFDVTVMGESELTAMGMNLMQAVGQGSDEESRLIILEYRGAGEDSPVHGLLGKGVTFDSGGVSLKAQSAMSHMHLDKTAGAVVLGIAVALAHLKVPINVTGVIPAVENMPDGKSYKPGDIIISHSGKSVEVVNTDAEGRLIMADSLSFMQRRLGIRHIIDFATLTGGSGAALGTDIIPLFANNREMIDRFVHACEHSGEACWEMPLYHKYRRFLNSSVADIKNHAEKAPSAIIGALFLHDFVEPRTQWMHLDIGGHEYRESDFSYQAAGATAIGMRSLIRYYLNFIDHPLPGPKTRRST